MKKIRTTTSAFNIAFLLLFSVDAIYAQNPNREYSDDKVGYYYKKAVYDEIEERITNYKGPYDYKTFIENVMPDDFEQANITMNYLKKSYWVSPFLYDSTPIYLEINKKSFKVFTFFKIPDKLVLLFESKDKPYFTDDFLPFSSYESQQVIRKKKNGYFLQPGNLFFSHMSKDSLCVNFGLGGTAMFTRVKELPKTEVASPESVGITGGMLHIDRILPLDRFWWDGDYYYDKLIYIQLRKASGKTY